METSEYFGSLRKASSAANDLASEAVATLSPEIIGAISVDAIDHGADIAPVVIVDVYEATYDDLPCRAWTREELLSSDLEALIERERAARVRVN
jgi:hypothetical protein